MSKYKPKAWASKGLSWPYCPAREIEDTEAKFIADVYGDEWLHELYEEVKDGGLSAKKDSARKADNV